ELGIADIETAIAAPAVKEQLRANTDQAIAAGVFGVPTILLGDRLIWGNDATSMLEKMLVDPDYFERGEYLRLASLPSAAERSR
ncbi:MAG: DsbA family protein, partial [Dokdonella sp.]